MRVLYNGVKGARKRGFLMLFRKRVSHYCSYCIHAAKINDDEMICEKKGIVPAANQCSRFRYDPLKRVPARKKPQNFDRFQKEDFAL